MSVSHPPLPRRVFARLSSRRRSVVSGVAALGLVLGALLAAGTPSFATTPATYTISGQVTADQSGGSPVPASDVSARLYSLTGDATGLAYLQSVEVTGGAFSFTGIAPGRYRIFFQADSGPSEVPAVGSSWLGSYYQDESTTVQVTDQNVTGLSQDLPATATISGTVTVTSAPSPGISGLDLAATAYLYDPTTGQYDQRNSAATSVGSDGSYTISGLAPGEWLVRIAAGGVNDESSLVTPGYFPSSDFETVTEAQAVTGADVSVGYLGTYQVGLDRLAGADRYETSVAVAQAFFPSSVPSGVVFVASGQNYPDALSASAAAGTFDSPLLLVDQNGVPSEVTAEIKQLAPADIVVVGGTGAVSAAAYEQLTKLVASPDDITRLWGSDRYATSRAVANFAFAGENAQTHLDAVFIATGTNYPDALVAGGAGGYDYSPVLLVNGSASSLDSATMQLLQTLDPGRIYIVGGTGAVSAGIEAQLDASTSAPVLRLSGEDRYDTAAAVDDEVFPFADDGFFATGEGYADALSISAVSGASGSPLYLTEPDCIPQNTWTGAMQQGVTTFFTVGGTGVIDNSVAQGLQVCAVSPSADRIGARPAQTADQASSSHAAAVRPGRPTLHF